MTAPIEKEIREVVLRPLGKVTPEVALDSINPSKNLCDQIDIDSVDFLNFVIGLHEELHIEIPDADVAKLRWTVALRICCLKAAVPDTF